MIHLAVELFEDKYPDLEINTEEYSIKIWRNPNTVIVDFSLLTRYIAEEKNETPIGYDLIMNLTKSTILPFVKRI